MFERSRVTLAGAGDDLYVVGLANFKLALHLAADRLAVLNRLNCLATNAWDLVQRTCRCPEDFSCTRKMIEEVLESERSNAVAKCELHKI